MALGTVQGARYGEAWDALSALVAVEGGTREPWAQALRGPDAAMRDLADAVHGWCALHARHPGVIEQVAARAEGEVASAWLAEAAAGFAMEREALVHLMAAVGPLPSTPGQAQTDMAIAGSVHSLDMLAASDRTGCPIGAVAALIEDWTTVRGVLDATATRLGIDLPASTLPVARDSSVAIGALAETAAFDRAMLFGASQMLAQHHALWQLLQARAEARVTAGN